MNLAFLDLIGEKKNGEAEFLERLKYCMHKKGHKLFVMNKFGLIDGVQETKDIDFVLTCNNFDFSLCALPDHFCVFLHWAPAGFMASFQMFALLKSMHSYDLIINGYESKKMENTIINSGNTCENIPFVASVPEDYCIFPEKEQERHLFYVGINRENQLKTMRYRTLFENLDKRGILDIYGPQKVYNMGNTWTGFSSYKGEIPFDGKSIIQKIHEAGIALALNSPMHNADQIVSARIFEAAAAGAVIIADDNAYIRKFFGDSIFYIDINKDEAETSKEILTIIEWCNNNKDKAYNMALKAQNIFKKNFLLDNMIEKLITAVNNKKEEITKNQDDTIDILCDISTEREILLLQSELSRQFYKNIHSIIFCSENLYKKVSDYLTDYNYTIIKKKEDNWGEKLIAAQSIMKGKYFMFWVADIYMHKRHIYKNLLSLKNTDALFSYSGSYIKNKERKIILNNRSIKSNEFLSCLYSNFTNFTERDNQVLYLETIFTKNCSLFKREVLNFTNENELKQISQAIHFYLVLCSLIKANKEGIFSNAITTFYEGSDIENVNRQYFPERKHMIENNRCSGTYFREMMEIFFTYHVNYEENDFPHRDYIHGEKVFFEDILNQEEKVPDKEIISTEKEIDKDEIFISNIISNHKLTYKVLKVLSHHKKQKYKNKKERIKKYLDNRPLLKICLQKLIKRKESNK